MTEECSEDEILDNINASDYPQEVKTDLVAFYREMMNKASVVGGKPKSKTKKLKGLNECGPEFYNKYGMRIYLLLASGALCIFNKDVKALYVFVVSLINSSEPIIEEIVVVEKEKAKERGLIDIMFWLHGMSAVLDRFTGFISNMATSGNNEKYMPKFIRTILNMFCMLYNKRVALNEAKRLIAEALAKDASDAHKHSPRVSSEDMTSYAPILRWLTGNGPTRGRRRRQKSKRKRQNKTRNKK
jgi:hypothetical protein